MSKLSRKLLFLFCKGDLEGTKAFDLAVDAWDDGWGRNCTIAVKIIKCGNGGKRRSHIAEDLIKVAFSEGITSTSCKPYRFSLSTGGTMTMFLPHEIYHKLVVTSSISRWCLTQAQLDSNVGLPPRLHVG